MKAELKSGAWVEMRDIGSLNAKDKAVMLAATQIAVNMMNPGESTMSLGGMTGQRHAVMARVITAWSFQYMIPSDDPSEDEDGSKTYEASIMYLPIDDYNELEDVIQPYIEKLSNTGPKEGLVTSSRSNGSSRARAASTRRA